MTPLIPRRPGAALAAVLAIGLLAIPACGSDTDDSAVSVTDTTEVADRDTVADDAAAFPVTIEHAFGSTTIESEPQRVVTVGFTDHDTVLALGVAPVGIRHWYGDYEYVWPWAEDALGDAEPAVIPETDLNFEQIAALEPDLILGLYAGLEPDEYEKLSAIAPTVAQSADHPAYGTPWQDMARTAGAALGRSPQADALVADIEGRFAAIRDANPEFDGRGLAYAGLYGDSQYYVETDGSTRMKILQDLGFVVPEELAALGTDSFYHDISAEQIDLVDQDVVLWEPADISLLPGIEDDPLYQSLGVAVDDREVILDDPLIAGAMAHSTVLSLPIALGFLEPELARAVGNLE